MSHAGSSPADDVNPSLCSNVYTARPAAPPPHRMFPAVPSAAAAYHRAEWVRATNSAMPPQHYTLRPSSGDRPAAVRWQLELPPVEGLAPCQKQAHAGIMQHVIVRRCPGLFKGGEKMILRGWDDW